jgi:predicted XRE-type DNA-binding protein
MEDIKLEKSSGNVFADIGLDAPEERLAKSDLALKIAAIISKRNLSQERAATLLGLTQPKVSAILNGKLKGFSLEKLMLFTVQLYQQVKEITAMASL